ncbi:MAG: nucleoside 2-deoxyribosyltransferase [Candidatus Methanomethylophilaceae archaeon]|nr:nucleoside 2-deoxyribosyltransferase [Candidatus Methanomethylophilaceae archaeon]
MRIYFAAPLFSQAEREFNSKVAAELRKEGFDVFLPQENSVIDGIPDTDEKRRRLLTGFFAKDIEAIESSDVLLIVLDGRVPDEGATFELGYAYARGKICVGLKTDSRVSEMGTDNAMIVGSLGDNIAKDLTSLSTILKSMRAIIEL